MPLTASVLVHLLVLASLLIASPARLRPEPPPLSVELVSLPTEPATAAAPAQAQAAEPPSPAQTPPAPDPAHTAAPAVIPASAPLLATAASAELALAAILPVPETPAPVAIPATPRVHRPDKPLHRPPEPRHQAIIPDTPASVPAPVATSQAPAPPPVTAPAVSPAPPAPARAADPSWQRALAAWLATHKHYPEEARENGQQGAVGVEFTVARDGLVRSVRIARSSGVSVLDRSVRDMLTNEHVPPFPTLMTEAQTEVRVTVQFELAQ